MNARVGELRLFDPSAAPAASNLPWASLAAGLAAAALIVAAAWVWRRTPPPDPAEQAFRALARMLRLTRAERALVRALAAAHGGAAPTAILLSESALADAARACASDDRDRVEHLSRKLRESAARLLAAG